MTKIKTNQAVQREYEAVKEELASLQKKQARLKLLQEVQRQGVSRSQGTWFVAGNGSQAGPAEST